MLSLVSVISDPAKADARLHRGLSRQTAAYQLITVDNRKGQFRGAAPALNWGGRQATGDWIVFLHQDVELLSVDWLERAEGFLRQLPPGGWSGVIGINQQGQWRGLVVDRTWVIGEPFHQPVEVQTLDELLLVHRNVGQEFAYFDDKVPGWHAYGVDACCSTIRQGARNHVLPLPVWHDSDTTNRQGLTESHAYVWQKHRDAFRMIHTSCGDLPAFYRGRRRRRIAAFLKRARDYSTWFRWTTRPAFQQTLGETLENLTKDVPVVECIHVCRSFPELESVGFTARTNSPRRIIHRFMGFKADDLRSDCVVVAPDLASSLVNLSQLPPGIRRLLICIDLGGPRRRPSYWRKTLGQPFSCHLAMEEDEQRWAILDMQVSCPGSF